MLPALASGVFARLGVARRRLQRAHEQREELDVDALIVDDAVVVHRVAVRGVLVRLQRAGDAHLVEIRIRRERDQAGLLALPAESPDSHRPRLLEDRHVDDLPAHRRRLCRGDRLQRAVADGFDEAVAEEALRPAEAEDVGPRLDDGLEVAHLLARDRESASRRDAR